MKPKAPLRADYARFREITTRWMDNDVYGHVNNVTYYSYFDTAVNEFLMRFTGLDYRKREPVGMVVETGCRFHSEIAFPDVLDVGVRVRRLGNSSVTYEIAIFKEGADALLLVRGGEQQSEPGPLELPPVVGPGHRGQLRGGGVVNEHAPVRGQAAHHQQVPAGARVGGPRELPLLRRDARHQGHPRTQQLQGLLCTL